MRNRSGHYGDRNICGARIEALRKKRCMKQAEMILLLRKKGISMGGSSYSRLEGQLRAVSDAELYALAEIFGISVEELLGKKQGRR